MTAQAFVPWPARSASTRATFFSTPLTLHAHAAFRHYARSHAADLSPSTSRSHPSSWSVETLGFLVGTWPSSALTVVVACLAASLIKVPLTKAFAAGIAVPLLAVLVEEIRFRPVLITWLHDGPARARTSWALAVLLSAAIWTVVHVPSKSASMLVGLFVTAVLLGALYAWSGTSVAGYVLHALANSGSGGAVIMFVLCLVLGGERS